MLGCVQCFIESCGTLRAKQDIRIFLFIIKTRMCQTGELMTPYRQMQTGFFNCVNLFLKDTTGKDRLLKNPHFLEHY